MFSVYKCFIHLSIMAFCIPCLILHGSAKKNSIGVNLRSCKFYGYGRK